MLNQCSRNYDQCILDKLFIFLLGVKVMLQQFMVLIFDKDKNLKSFAKSHIIAKRAI